jgi:hypothetical protein
MGVIMTGEVIDQEICDSIQDDLVIPYVIEDESIEFEGSQSNLFTAKRFLEEGRYFTTLDELDNAMISVEETMKKFQGLNLSCAIISSQKLLNLLKAVDLDVTEFEEVVTAVDACFSMGIYEEATNLMDKLKYDIIKMQQEQSEKISAMISMLKENSDDQKNLGFDISELEECLQHSNNFFRNSFILECIDRINCTGQPDEESRKEQVGMMKEAIDFVEGLIEDAKSIGAFVDIPEANLEKARSLWDEEDFQMSIYKIIEAEEKVNRLIQNQVNKALGLRKTMEDRYWTVVSSKLKSQSKNKRDEAKVEILNHEVHTCKRCGERTYYLEQWRRWYCYKCRE